MLLTAWEDAILILMARVLDPEGNQDLETITIILLALCVVGLPLLFGYSTYLRCRWGYYERIILRQNIERFSFPHEHFLSF